MNWLRWVIVLIAAACLVVPSQATTPGSAAFVNPFAAAFFRQPALGWRFGTSYGLGFPAAPVAAAWPYPGASFLSLVPGYGNPYPYTFGVKKGVSVTGFKQGYAFGRGRPLDTQVIPDGVIVDSNGIPL